MDQMEQRQQHEDEYLLCTRRKLHLAHDRGSALKLTFPAQIQNKSTNLSIVMNANQTTTNLARSIAIAYCIATAGVLLSAHDPAQAENIFPELTINGKVHTAVSVAWATPVEVLLRWENTGAGICKRQALPAELASCYPYDPKAAEQWTQT